MDDGDLDARILLAEGNSINPCHERRNTPRSCSIAGARMVFDSGRLIAHVARDLGIHREALRKWVRKTEADEGKRKDLLSLPGARGAGPAAQGQPRTAPRQRDSKAASAFFAAELDPHRPK